MPDRPRLNLAAERLNRIAEEGEDNWSCTFEDGTFKFERVVRAVAERAALDPAHYWRFLTRAVSLSVLKA